MRNKNQCGATGIGRFGAGCVGLGYCLASTLSGCSSSDTPVPAAVVQQPLTIELFAARGSFGRRDFERYRVENDTLFAECGTVSKGVASPGVAAGLSGPAAPQVPSKPSVDALSSKDLEITPEQSNIDVVPSGDLADIKERTADFLDSIDSEALSKLPPPSNAITFSKPGVFELDVSFGDKKQRIRTTLDAVSSAENDSLEQIRALFAKLRATAPVICGDASFYGIGRSPDGPFEPEGPGAS